MTLLFQRSIIGIISNIQQPSININFLYMRSYADQTKLTTGSEEEEYYFLQPMFEKHPPNELLSPKHAPDVATQVKLITAKDERRNNVQYYPPRQKNAEMQTYAAAFALFDSLGRYYSDKMNQIVFFKFNNTKYNLLPQSPLRTRIMPAFYLPFQQIRRHFPSMNPFAPNYNHQLSAAKCNRGCSFDPIFSSNYQSANLFAVVRKNPYEYDLILQHDTNSCESINWFNFTVQFCQEGYYSFKIVNLTEDMTKLYERGMKIAYCYINSFEVKQQQTNGEGWGFCGNNIKFSKSHVTRENKIGENYFQLYFQFKCKNKKDVLMFSTDIPYTTLDSEKFFNKILLRKFKNLIKIEKQQFGKSIAGCPLVSYVIKRRKLRDSVQMSPLSSQTLLRSKDKRKSTNLTPINRPSNLDNNTKSIVIFGRVGGSDINSSYTIEGMIEYLIDSLQVEPMKRAFDFYFVPLVNVDAVRYGHSVSNLTGSLINSNWRNPHLQYQPEIYYLKEYLQEISKESTISLLINLTTERQDIVSSVIGIRKKDDQSEDSRIFPYVMSKRFNYISFERSTFYQRNENNSMPCVLNELYPKSLIYQLKISHFEATNRSEDSPSNQEESQLFQCKPQDYRSIGKDILSSYLEHAKLYDRNVLLRDKWIKQIEQLESNIVRKKHIFIEDTSVIDRFSSSFCQVNHQYSITPVFKSSNALISSKFLSAPKVFNAENIPKDFKKQKQNGNILTHSGNQINSKRNRKEVSLRNQLLHNQTSKSKNGANSEKQISIFRLNEKKTSILLNYPQNSLTFEVDEPNLKAKHEKQRFDREVLKKQPSAKFLRKVRAEDAKQKSKGTGVKISSGQYLNNS